MTKQTELNFWERSQIGLWAMGHALTYGSHFSKGGNFTVRELDEANRWRALGNKFTSKPTKPWTADDFPNSNFRPGEAL